MTDIIDEMVGRRMAAEALKSALFEWETKLTLVAPNGFLKPRASSKDPKPQNKAAWLKKRTAELLEQT